jgi:hypothetical protein
MIVIVMKLELHGGWLKAILKQIEERRVELV